MFKKFIAVMVVALASVGMAAGFSVGVVGFHQDVGVAAEVSVPATESFEFVVGASYEPFSGDVDANLGVRFVVAESVDTNLWLAARYFTPVMTGGNLNLLAHHDAGLALVFDENDGPFSLEIGARSGHTFDWISAHVAFLYTF